MAVWLRPGTFRKIHTFNDPSYHSESTPSYPQPEEQLSNFFAFLDTLVETTHEWHFGFGFPEILVVRECCAESQDVYEWQDVLPYWWVGGAEYFTQSDGDG